MTKKRVNFKERWGIPCNDLAEMEGVTPEAIRMRVLNFGTPFQRRGKPTKFEAKYGKTLGQLALDLGIHPITVARREYLYGDIHYSEFEKPELQGQILNKEGFHWTENPKMFYIRMDSTYMDQYDENKKN